MPADKSEDAVVAMADILQPELRRPQQVLKLSCDDYIMI